MSTCRIKDMNNAVKNAIVRGPSYAYVKDKEKVTVNVCIVRLARSLSCKV